jgi:hypothetical protein
VLFPPQAELVTGHGQAAQVANIYAAVSSAPRADLPEHPKLYPGVVPTPTVLVQIAHVPSLAELPPEARMFAGVVPPEAAIFIGVPPLAAVLPPRPELIAGFGKPSEVLPFIGFAFVPPPFPGGIPCPIRIGAGDWMTVTIQGLEAMAADLGAYELAAVTIRAWERLITGTVPATAAGIALTGSEGPPT